MNPRHPDVGLLRALRSAPGNFIPADDLSDQAGCGSDELASRLEQLHAVGYGFEGDQKRGWRLTASPDQLVADDLLAALPEQKCIGREILVFQETNSTNDLAAKAGSDGAAEGLAIFAETQRAGRGRLGRKWNSPPHQGLWFSLLLRPAVPASRWPELTFCAALAVAEAAEIETGCAARIKWPNDVLLGGRKIAGILLECHHHQPPGFVVVGIGINVRQQAEDFPTELRASAGSLAMAAGQLIERRSVTATVLSAFERIYADWPSGFGEIMDECARRRCSQEYSQK